MLSKPVLPDSVAPIADSNGFAEQRMRSWMLSIQRSSEHFIDNDENTNHISITKEADFPVQDATTITLETGKTYIIKKQVITGKRFIVQNGVYITSKNSFYSALIYTGTGVMFTSVNASWAINQLGFECPNGTLIDFSGAGISVVQDSSIYAVKHLGSFTGTGTNFTNFNWSNVLIASITGQGFVFNNDIRILSATKVFTVATSVTHKLFDISNAVVSGGEFRDIEPSGPSGSSFLYALANSANISANNILTIESCGLGASAMAPLAGGITISDIRVEASDNGGLEDTISDALIYFNGNATNTTFSAVNTPTLINSSTWATERLSKFSTNGSGKLTSLSEKRITFPTDDVFYVQATTGTPVTVSVYLALTGTILPSTKVTAQISNVSPSRFVIPWQLNLNVNDYTQAYIENNTNSTAVLVTNGIRRIR